MPVYCVLSSPFVLFFYIADFLLNPTGSHPLTFPWEEKATSQTFPNSTQIHLLNK